MFTNFKRSSRLVFLDPDDREILTCEKGEKLALILSVKIYWVKKISLPLSSVREVKKLLPSIFEDSLPEGHYSYYAYKDEEEFILFAYEDKKILDLISSKGISSADIASVHFAQCEFAHIEVPMSINEDESIYVKDGLLLLVPSDWLEVKQELKLDDIKLSKHSIKLQQFGHIVDNNSLYKIAAGMVVLILILLVEIFVANAKYEEIVQKKEALFSKYGLQATMIQNRSTHSKYSKIHKRQTKLREAIALF
ncbi:MAG: hypothetical protein Q9M40_05705 [Sulfurimonas sp.]|nr:hypothetical protein [Sulfurimonas sp.]